MGHGKKWFSVTTVSKTPPMIKKNPGFYLKQRQNACASSSHFLVTDFKDTAAIGNITTIGCNMVMSFIATHAMQRMPLCKHRSYRQVIHVRINYNILHYIKVHYGTLYCIAVHDHSLHHKTLHAYTNAQKGTP